MLNCPHLTFKYYNNRRVHKYPKEVNNSVELIDCEVDSRVIRVKILGYPIRLCLAKLRWTSN